MKTTDENFITDAVNKYSDTVFRVAFQYTKSRSDAEDILQEVYLKLLKKPPALEGDELKAWLIRVTVNSGKDWLRFHKRQNKLRSGFEPHSPPSCHDEVFDALDRLSERDRNALYLHYYEGYTAREIAGITGGSERSVTKRIGRAREKMKNFLQEEQPL